MPPVPIMDINAYAIFAPKDSLITIPIDRKPVKCKPAITCAVNSLLSSFWFGKSEFTCALFMHTIFKS